MTTTFTVYTMTPKGNFSQKYTGTDEAEAQKAYKRLEAKNSPRVLNKIEGLVARAVQTGGGFPE